MNSQTVVGIVAIAGGVVLMFVAGLVGLGLAVIASGAYICAQSRTS